MLENDITEKTHRLTQLLEKHMGTRGKTFEAAVRRAGRRLPRGLRAKAQVLISAQHMAVHPKLMRRVDPEEVAAAYDALEAHLIQMDLTEQRKTRALNIAAGLALNLLLVGGVVLAVMRWRGLV
ncbi:MAG: hypothetical protein AAF999_17105 [Pseudomonadota bacterium]